MLFQSRPDMLTCLGWSTSQGQVRMNILSRWVSPEEDLTPFTIALEECSTALTDLSWKSRTQYNLSAMSSWSILYVYVSCRDVWKSYNKKGRKRSKNTFRPDLAIANLTDPTQSSTPTYRNLPTRSSKRLQNLSKRNTNLLNIKILKLISETYLMSN